MIRHHPTPELLADYARGALDEGASLILACHIAVCPLCRSEAALWESAAGAMLEDAEPVAMNTAAVDQVLARLGTQEAKAVPELPGFMRRYDVPAPLARHSIAIRRWVTPNIWFAPVDAAPLTYLVFARRNTILPRHMHRGRELTYVLDGAFDDALGRFEAGDFAQTDGSIEHAPTATPEGSCLCLIHSEAPMRLRHRPARMLQSLFGKRY